jgi:hypothetical protein
MSQRAYFYWKGCEFIYGNITVQYNAVAKFKVQNSKIECLKALSSIQTYFELPEMHTTSLFHRDLLEEAKRKQNGKVFTTHPQDANLAAIACSLETNYLKSYIPLGWVGSSPKSAGVAISAYGLNGGKDTDRQDLDSLKIEYEEKVARSNLQYHYFAGDFAIGSIPIYLWQALLKTSALRNQLINRLLTCWVLKLILFSSAQLHVTKSIQPNRSDQNMVRQLLHRNHCNYRLVRVLSFGFLVLIALRKTISTPLKAVRRSYRIITKKHIKLTIRRENEPDITIADASKIALHKARKLRGFEKGFG